MPKYHPPREDDFYFDVAKGNRTGYSVVHKFGRNISLTTSFTPAALGGVYRTPTAAASLEFVSNAAGDALNGTGMHELTIVGLDANWAEQTVSVAAHATDGTTAVAITGTWLRVYRAYVSSSGAYADVSTGSHAGDITIRAASAGATWATISDADYPLGQTEIGAYTVPLGKTAYVPSIHVDVASAQTVDVLFLQRPNANDISSSYAGTMRVIVQFDQLADADDIHPSTPFGPFVGPCDLIMMAKGTAGNDVDVDFEIIVVDD